MPPALKPPVRGKGKPIETHPRQVGLVPVQRNWGAIQGGIPYKPGRRQYQETWETVARDFGVDVDDLIHFNFLTTKSNVVNWYLRENVGCFQPSPSGNNWMFSKGMVPGIIYIPPKEPEDKSYEYEPEGAMCSWSPNGMADFRKQLHAVAQGIPGEKGKRIKRLVQVIGRGRPWVDDQYWYYHPVVVEKYVDWRTQPSVRSQAIQAKKTFPFDGQSAWHGQQQSEAGGEEFSLGMWRIHAVQKMFEDFCSHVDPAAVKKRLLAIDSEMYQGWYAMKVATDVRPSLGGGDATVQEVLDFIGHVRDLTKDEKNLYWAFGN